MTINDKGITFEVKTTRSVKNRLSSGNDRAAAADRRNNLCGPDWVVGWARIIERRIWQMSQKGVLRKRVVKEAPSRSYYRSPSSADVPCGAQPRSKVLVVRFVQAAEPRLTHWC